MIGEYVIAGHEPRCERWPSDPECPEDASPDERRQLIAAFGHAGAMARRFAEAQRLELADSRSTT